MKKLCLPILLIVLFASCQKDHSATLPVTLNGKLIGKWNFISVTTVFRDTTGKTLAGGAVYSNPPDSYFQFNTNGTWGSKFVADPGLGPDNAGFYTADSDTSFTLSDTGKYAYSEKCKIYTLTTSLLLFSHTRNTLINGVTPATIEYIFKLTK